VIDAASLCRLSGKDDSIFALGKPGRGAAVVIRRMRTARAAYDTSRLVLDEHQPTEVREPQ
jgi:hypothetical protein